MNNQKNKSITNPIMNTYDEVHLHEFHHPHTPPHIHHARVETISVVPDTDKLINTYGDLWPYQLEAISKEPAEMKILFALELGLTLTVNYEPDRTPACRFENPVLSDEVLQKLEDRLCIDKQTIYAILDYAPPGVVAIICATVSNK